MILLENVTKNQTAICAPTRRVAQTWAVMPDFPLQRIGFYLSSRMVEHGTYLLE